VTTSPVASRILLADTVTRLTAAHAGCVLVTGSHGGLVAARYAVRAGVRAAIFNDAGVGLEDAGIAGLRWLDALGIAAAAVTHTSARIADAADSLAHGRIGHANAVARACGVAAGDACRDAAERLRHARWMCTAVDDAGTPEGRTMLARSVGDRVAVVGLDSIGLVTADDAGLVLVIGSHGGLHGGDPDSALPVAARGAFFHDAGGGKDGAGCTRLPVLAARGMPAATVDYRTARIGDARSLWMQGVLSGVNAPMQAQGIVIGTAVRDAALALAAARPR
jgi:hypothetical protein